MASIIFIKHPIIEPPYGNANLNDKIRILWSTNGHYRKFIKRDGEYINNKHIVDYAPLYFWGEYEPYSCATIIQHSRPKAIHDDLKSVRDIATTPNPISLFPLPWNNGLNTDLYVFGDRFRYICCEKTKLQKKKKLAAGDILIFGNVINSYFNFDTVFVYKEDMTSTTDEQYYHACMQPANASSYSIGYMYQDNYTPDGYPIFSFAPCLPNLFHSISDLNMARAFQKPKLSCAMFGIPTGQNNARINPCISHLELSEEIWNIILNAVTDANLYVGIHFAEI